MTAAMAPDMELAGVDSNAPAMASCVSPSNDSWLDAVCEVVQHMQFMRSTAVGDAACQHVCS